MSTPAKEMDTRQNDLLQEASDWRLISLLFQCPGEDWLKQVAALASETRDADLRTAAEAAQTEASEGLYHSIFGPGGPAPPREVSYRNWAQPGYLIAELGSYYSAFSYHPELCEAADHVSVESGFIAYLRLKEAFALACSDVEHAAVAREAAQEFIKEHLSAMAQRLAASLAESGVNHLALAGAALVRRTGPSRETHPKLELPILSDINESVDCGDI